MLLVPAQSDRAAAGVAKGNWALMTLLS